MNPDWIPNSLVFSQYSWQLLIGLPGCFVSSRVFVNSAHDITKPSYVCFSTENADSRPHTIHFWGQATSVDGHRRHGGFALGEYILLEDFKTVQGFRTRREALLASSGR